MFSSSLSRDSKMFIKFLGQFKYYMEKRAQVTAFVIVGIVLLAVIGFFIYARSAGIGISPERFLAGKKSDIESRIDECTRDLSVRLLQRIGLQGGTLTPLRAVQFNGNRVSYLCYNIPGNDNCVNRVLTLKAIEEELSRYLENNLRTCISIEDFRQPSYSLESANLEATATIGKNNILVVVDYPITLSKDAARLTLSRYTSTLNIPLGRLYLAAIDIIDSEAQVGDFDPLPYMLVHNTVRIEKHRPFPDKVYIMNVRGNSYLFQFGIEGEQ